MPTRCRWVPENIPLYIAYHDEEWGVPVHDDRKLYELFLLETFQAGLSWLTILRKRENFRQAFDGFDVSRVAEYGEDKIELLLSDPGIIRSRRKIEAAIRNARIFLDLQREFGSFANFLWGYTDGRVLRSETGEIPVKTELSDRVSAELQRRGMKFVGSVTIYSYLQAVGVVNDHEPACFCRNHT